MEAAETSTNIGATLLLENITPDPRSQPSILPREPPGQDVQVTRGSCRGQALRRPHKLHPASLK